jgi:hypothetical protein
MVLPHSRASSGLDRVHMYRVRQGLRASLWCVPLQTHCTLQPIPMSSASVSFSIHPTIRNKPPHWQPDFASGWQSCEGSLDDLRTHVTTGGAFIPAAMSSEHRNSAAFKYADLAVVDVDHGLNLDAFRDHPLAGSACFVYTTASHAPDHPRFRVIFRLPRRIDNPDLYKALVGILSAALGGDKSCTDPCRLFYGCDTAEIPHWQPEAVLSEAIIGDARAKADATQARQQLDSVYDDYTLAQAAYVLENVLRPTEDGERDRFIKVTAAACSGGEALLAPWQNWASRCHHTTGHRAKQGSERFFCGFRNTRSSVTTLFYLAGQDDPNWHSTLPEELRNTEYKPPKTHKAYGYEHEDFASAHYDDPFDAALAMADQDDSRTPSLFDTDRPWAVMPKTAATATQTAPRVAAAPVAPSPHEPPPIPDFDDDDDDYEDEDEELMRASGLYDDEPPTSLDNLEPPAAHANLDRPLPAIPRRRGRGRGNVPENLVAAIHHHLVRLYPGLRLNMMNQDLEYGPLDQATTIQDITTAYCRISRNANFTFPKQAVIDVANVIAYENRVHPVKAYLNHCLTNVPPCPYFGTLATELLGLSRDPLLNPKFTRGPAKDRLLADVIIERFLIGAVARVLEPGCTHDWMPILVGSQNCGKSTFFQYLTPPSPNEPGTYPWASTIQQGIRTLKEKPHLLHAGWLIVLDETERYFQRSYVEELKNLLSVSVDRSARKYENERNFPRAFVLCGATNSDDFFVDPTGNRRFMPIVVKGKLPNAENPKALVIDLDRLKADRDSIWAAAYKAYLDNPKHHFSSDELLQIEEYQDNFCTDNPFEARVRNALSIRHSGIHDGRSYVTCSDLYEWLDIPVDRHKSVQQPITDALKKLGYVMKRTRIGGQPRRIWLKPVSSPES